jgi:hypothetical protein
MDKKNLLLFAPPYILPADVGLTPKCEKCGDSKIIGQVIVLSKLCGTGLRDDDEQASMSSL